MGATYPAPLIRISGETLALSSTLASLGFPENAHQVLLYDPAVDFRLHLNPALLDAVYYDASASAGSRWVKAGSSNSLRRDLADRDTANGTAAIMDLGTTSDFLYLRFADVIGGIRVVIGDANAEAATITAKYRKNDDTWTTLTPTDGTASGGALFAVTGSVTWTAVTDWKSAQMGGPSNPISTDADAPTGEGFWLQLGWSAALGANVEIDEIWALNKDTSRGYFRAGVEYALSLDRRKVGAFEAVLASGTDTLQVTLLRSAQ